MAREVLVGVTEARDRLKDLVEEVGEHDVVMLRRNKPVAVLVHPDRIERLVSRIEDLEDEVSIMATRLEPESTVAHEEIRREVLGNERRAATA